MEEAVKKGGKGRAKKEGMLAERCGRVDVEGRGEAGEGIESMVMALRRKRRG